MPYEYYYVPQVYTVFSVKLLILLVPFAKSTMCICKILLEIRVKIRGADMLLQTSADA